MLRRLLLLPLLTPLLTVLVVGALNPRPGVSLRLLTWTSTPLPLGAWIALAGAGGAALSAGATALALGEGASPLRRQVRRRATAEAPEPWEEELEGAFAPSQRREQTIETPNPWATAGFSRAPGEPLPTVAVPFRVIRRGQAGPAAPPQAESDRAPSSSWSRATAEEPQRQGIPEPVAAENDWEASASDDW